MALDVPQENRQLDGQTPPIHSEQLFSDPLSNMSAQPRMSGIRGKSLMWKSLKQTE